MGNSVEETVEIYLRGRYDLQTKNQIRKIQAEDPMQLEELFSGHLTFGTGGMRGLVGIGPNRMNVYTVREATLGLAVYLKKMSSKKKQLAVVIGYDSRKTSRTFAFEAAKTLAQQGVSSYIFNEMRPLSLVSFGVRYFSADGGIMITASHNPPEYNGYKVYWSDGGQITAPHDVEIEKEIANIRGQGAIPATIAEDPYIHVLQKEVDEAYMEALKKMQLYPATSKKELHIVYSPLHGTGAMIVPQVLYQAGLTSVSFVKPQMVTDGTFSTTPSPNPESKEALQLGIEQLEKEKADIFLATDPDADRLGVVIMHQGKPVILTGNQIAALMIFGIFSSLSPETLFQNKIVVETIVTTPLIQKITQYFGGSVEWVLTGFKYIAEKIRQHELNPEGPQVVFGCEESLGSLYGTYVRDKDGVEACMIISEIAWKCKQEGKTLYDLLEELWRQFGYYEEKVITCAFSDTQEGRAEMARIMECVRNAPPKSIGDISIIAYEDLFQKKFFGDEQYKVGDQVPASNVICLSLNDGSKVIVRPSGTEPKVKIYIMAHEEVGVKELSDVQKYVHDKIEGLVAFLREMFR